MLVDYIFAFGALGLSGLFSKSKNGLVKGYIAGVLGRYFFAFLSGMIFFGAYAADYGMSAPVYSLVYNGIYLSVEAVLTPDSFLSYGKLRFHAIRNTPRGCAKAHSFSQFCKIQKISILQVFSYRLPAGR